MGPEIWLAVTVMAIAVAFDFTNGFHDAANAIATAVSTRALRPRAALTMSAIMNLIGALMGTAVAETIATQIVNLGGLDKHEQLSIVLAGLLGAIAWNLLTWWLGLPSSSSHALIGGLAGAGLGAILIQWDDVAVKWDKIGEKVLIPMVASPAIGFTLAFFAMVGVLWLFRNSSPHRTMRRFRVAQIGSSAAMALGHGLQDAQKTMGVIFMASIAVGWNTAGDPIPIWIKVLAACAISAGTYSGGWRIMRTLGRRVIELDPARGFVAETVGALVLYLAAFTPIHAPISTTHTITSAIMGVGATRSLSAVRWGVAKNIVIAWLLTMPAAAATAILAFLAIQGIGGLF
ncbi:MAG: inorganic phosphate transporter [Bifidobacteriaceae bacterium]|jgi:PiT family inorganic phosphate transporter|nr:inorganic phosphate transporter [Bifidobacteriaceae bacterium]